ncbi:MAG: hypothetical protein GY751_03220 [Bacteroidetes bacterium]|nr:hypothetical protein [Bacteroidota bacterium]
MKSYTFLSILISLVFACPLYAQEDAQSAAPVSIGNLDGNEVIVHVYRDKVDAFPFIEFSVTIDESTGNQIVEITEVEGGTTDGGFMIISGVKRAGEVGVTASSTYEISFSKVGDYKIYEKAVMDYLRRLPIPEIEQVIHETDETMFGSTTGSASDTIDLITYDLQDEELFDQESETEEPVYESIDENPVTGIKVDSNSVIVHVHRNSEDIDPFKEFVLTTEVVAGEEKINVTEGKSLQPQGKFMIMTGFTDSLGDISKSRAYDAIAYNLDEYSDYEQAVLDFMLRLTNDQFSGEEATIGLNWEEEVEAKEPEVVARPAKPTFPDSKREIRQKVKANKPNEREINQTAKNLEKAKYKAPKRKDKYGIKKSKRMTERMKGHGKKTSCPSFRY